MTREELLLDLKLTLATVKEYMAIITPVLLESNRLALYSKILSRNMIDARIIAVFVPQLRTTIEEMEKNHE